MFSSIVKAISPRILLQSRAIATSSVRPIKQIDIQKENESVVIQGLTVESPRNDKMLKEACNPKFCPECTLGLEIKHTDVLILSQYLRSDGCMLPRRITGLCKRQQKRMSSLVAMAQKAGLMPNIGPANSKKDPKRRYEWRKYNKYYYEQSIRY